MERMLGAPLAKTLMLEFAQAFYAVFVQAQIDQHQCPCKLACINSPDKCTLPRCTMLRGLRGLWSTDDGQDIAEYAVMLAVILVIVIGTTRLIGGNANNVFSTVANSIQ
jgi:Flp pilus assembly pilin Flp